MSSEHLSSNPVEVEELSENEAHASILQTIESKGEPWIIAAMVDGSVGYYSPFLAKRRLDEIRAGERWLSERVICCFRGSYIDEFWFDVKAFERKESYAPERVQQLVQMMTKVLKESAIDQWTFSALYPTSVL